ncbi:hypothetical protein Hamer_G019412, partial [Homarus americanus]
MQQQLGDFKTSSGVIIITTIVLGTFIKLPDMDTAEVAANVCRWVASALCREERKATLKRWRVFSTTPLSEYRTSTWIT